MTLAPGEPIPTAAGAVAHGTQPTGAVIIRDPRLTRARILGDQDGGPEKIGATTSATQQIGAISKAMDVLSAEISITRNSVARLVDNGGDQGHVTIRYKKVVDPLQRRTLLRGLMASTTDESGAI